MGRVARREPRVAPGSPVKTFYHMSHADFNSAINKNPV
jgi:hypothetical protein